MSLSATNAVFGCLPRIQRNIGPVIPSLSGNRHFVINMSSFIHNEVRGELTMDDSE
jgi:hypothetical protein